MLEVVKISLAIYHKFTHFYVRHRSRILRCLYIYLLVSLFGSTANLNFKSKLLNLYKQRNKIITQLQKKVSKQADTDSQVLIKDDKNITRKFKPTRTLPEFLFSVSDGLVVKILLLQILVIFSKTYLQLKVISIDSKLVSSIFSKDYKNFLKLTSYWLLIGAPVSLFSSYSTYLTNTLSKTLSENISKDLIRTYLAINSKENKESNANVFYKINHFVNNKISDPHQRLAIDVFEFCNNLSSLVPMVFNPLLNLVISSSKLFNYDGGSMTEVTLLFGLIVNVSTILIKLASPSFSKIANNFSQLESDFRQVHSNIIHHYEQIALLKSWRRESYDADSYYFVMENFMKHNYRKFALYNFVKTFIIKYTWGALGLSLCAFPVFKNYFQSIPENFKQNKVTEDFVQNRSLLMNASNAMGDLLSSKKNFDQITGTSKRIIELKNALMELKFDDNTFEISQKGKVNHDNEMITFKEVPLYTPTNQLLCRPLNFTIKQGDNLLIVGPNGSGKSSLFRILSGLWPVKEGELTIPEYNSVFYLPQRPYLIKGKTNLVEQIIYPKTFHEFEVELSTLSTKNSKHKYLSLINILRFLELDYLLKDNIEEDSEEDILTFDALKKISDNDSEEDSESDSDSHDGTTSYQSMVSVLLMVKDWSTQLSIGSQQKLAMARLYYHKPKFAVLDECTSQVTPEMESKMYTHATKELGITVLSVAHRTSIWKFHKYVLQFDGKGDYIFKRFNYKKRLRLAEEKLEIEKKLNNIPSLKARLQELNIVQERKLIKGN